MLVYVVKRSVGGSLQTIMSDQGLYHIKGTVFDKNKVFPVFFFGGETC